MSGPQVVLVVLGIIVTMVGLWLGGTNGPYRGAGPVMLIGGILIGLTSLLLSSRKKSDHVRRE